MNPTIAQETFVCSRCIARGVASRARSRARHALRPFSTAPRRLDGSGGKQAEEQRGPEQGAMSRRLAQMTEESVEEGGRSARKVVEEAGFSEELKRQLEARITLGKAQQLDTKASAILSMPDSAGAATRDAALATPWTGVESVEDASNRMLQDAYKPIRGGSGGSPRIKPRAASIPVDMRMKNSLKRSSGERLVNARDKTSIYAITQDPNLSEKEKEDMRKVLRERFQPGARPMPNTLQGLSSLANERIEDAIARGQFKNIPRGKGVGKEVDHNANSPFINTTEYFLNKMIKRQDIVPPFVEKNQEVVKTANAFRQRLRNDWKRHAARKIASQGGSLDQQVERAVAYAVAEAEHNPRAQKVETVSQLGTDGKLTQVNIIETPAAPTDIEDSKIIIVETPLGQAAAEVATEVAATSSASLDAAAETQAEPAAAPPTSAFPADGSQAEAEADTAAAADPPTPPLRLASPFRDAAWEQIELAYHSAALKQLNDLTRTYNLMAPELAKKPYYSLKRELASCFADVAPQLANEIRERARLPAKIKVEVIGHTPGSVLERFAGEKAKVYDSRKPNYGFKEFWKDLFGGAGGEEKRV